MVTITSTDNLRDPANSGLPRDAEDRILYNLSNGRLQFDPDGDTPGGQDPITFAILTGAPADVAFNDFAVI